MRYCNRFATKVGRQLWDMICREHHCVAGVLPGDAGGDLGDGGVEAECGHDDPFQEYQHLPGRVVCYNSSYTSYY